MTKQIFPIVNEAEWLKLRVEDITSTEVSALYGLSPYSSEFEIFHQKKDKQVVTLEPNERMKWGNRLEAAIAHGAAEEMGWTIEPMKVYIRDADLRMGSSFDFKIIDPVKGDGIMEVKNVDGIQYARNWIDDGEGNIEAPEHIELQVQHEMEVADLDWAAIVVLVGGNTQKIAFRKRDKAIGADLRKRVAEFWKKVEQGIAPSPDYTLDAEYIIKQLRTESDPDLIMDAGEELQELIKKYSFVKKEANDMDKLATQLKAQILDMIGTASKVITPFGTLSCSTTKPSQGKLVTPDMIGTYIGARAGFRNFRYTAKKEK